MSKTPRTEELVARWCENPTNDTRYWTDELEIFETELADKDKQLAEARADVKDRDNALAAIMAVLPDGAKPCDAPDLIKHFKSQMSAFGSEYIRIEKQLKEVRTDIEIMTGKLKTEREFSERRGKLIEQIRDALKAMLRYPMLPIELVEIAEAALAAERGE